MNEQMIIDAAHKAGLTHYIEQHGQFLIRLAKFAQLLQQRGGEPDGWKLVPIEPTLQQKVAIYNFFYEINYGASAGMWTDENVKVQLYKTMLSAAPTPPASDKVDAERDELKAKLESNVVTDNTEALHEALKRNEMLRDALIRAGRHISEITFACGKYAGLHGDIVRDSYTEAAAVEEALNQPDTSNLVVCDARPFGYVYDVNETYTFFLKNEPPDDAYDEGSLVRVYARKGDQ